LKIVEAVHMFVRRVAFIAALPIVFTLGYVMHAMPARGAGEALQPTVVDVTALTPDDLATPAAGTDFRAKTFVATDGATVAVQVGVTPKHYHANTDEIQYVVSGTGTELLGDTVRQLRPGVLLIIPKGTPHGGIVETVAPVKILSIKTPPQAPDDTHRLP
jgi:mannose-6-phosphate isomerase-like protein (cupin superfamily)